MIPRRLSSQHPFTITFHHAANVKCYQTRAAQFYPAWKAFVISCNSRREGPLWIKQFCWKCVLDLIQLLVCWYKFFWWPWVSKKKDKIVSPFLDLTLFKCQIVLCVSTPDLEVWIRVEDRMSTSPPNSYHRGPNSSCAVCVGISHKHHTQKAYNFVVIYASVQMLVAVK